MTELKYVNVLFSLSGIAGVFFVLWVLYPRYAVDRFRQEMFALRDELFDSAIAGRIGFDSPAYVMLRSLMNSHIRFAHRLGLVETLVLVVTTRKYAKQYGEDFARQYASAIRGLDPEQRELVESYYLRTMQLIFRKLVLGSAFVMLVLPALLGAYAAKHWVRRLLTRFSKPVDMVNGTAIAETSAIGLCAC